MVRPRPLLLLALVFGFATLSFGAGVGEEERDWRRIPVRFHLVADLPMRKAGVMLEPWIEAAQIVRTVLPEVNRIWLPARVEWTLASVDVVAAAAERRPEVVAFVVGSMRDADGHGDPERIRRLVALLPAEGEAPGEVHVYVVPYLGGTSQGNATPRQRRVLVGQWTDKASGGRRPPERCLLVETGEFQRGSFSRTVAHELGHVLGLAHPLPGRPPFGRLMGGTRPGDTLTAAEQFSAWSRAGQLWPAGGDPR
jgi:hypothetical protein